MLAIVQEQQQVPRCEMLRERDDHRPPRLLLDTQRRSDGQRDEPRVGHGC